MSDYRVEYGQRETTPRGFVNGLDTGDPVGPFRTFEQTPERRFYIDNVEVDIETFRAAVDADRVLIETRLYGAPSDPIAWDR